MKPGKDCIGVFVTAVLHDGAGNFLMAKRGQNARDNHGRWEFGGGTVEVGEKLEETLMREYAEELGVVPFNIKFIEMREFVNEGYHWIGAFFVAQIDPATPRIVEPVFDELQWFTSATMPENMMEGDRERMSHYVTQF
jgi:8-oxo-dGTP pyrophosphatase MutT (NUDIX family)